VAAFAIDCYLHYRHGRPGQANPWRAGTLEWTLRMPAPAYNFISIPRLTERYPLWHNPELAVHMERGQGYLANPDYEARQTFFGGVLDSKPECVVHLPRNTYLPLILGVVTAFLFTGLLVKWYWLSLAVLVVLIPLFLRWFWRNDTDQAPALIDAGHGLLLPTQARISKGPGWWGLMLTLLADASLYGSLLFGYLFLWTVAEQWPPHGFGTEPLLVPAVGLGLLLASSAVMAWARGANRRGRIRQLRWGFGLGLVLALAYALCQAWMLRYFPYGPTEHAYGAIVFAIVGCHLIHLLIAMLMNGFTLARSLRGYVDAERTTEVENSLLFWQYMVGQWGIGFVLIHLLSRAV